MTATRKAKTKAKKKANPRRRRADDAAVDLPFGAEPFIAPVASDASLHDLFQRQTMDMLDRSDLSEEQKQSILVAMNCPCCGGSGLSFTMKLRRKR